MGFLLRQFRALGECDLPNTVTLDGKPYRLKSTFKHNFISAVGVYRHAADTVVCKYYRDAPFFGLPLRPFGRLLAAYESAVLRRVDDIEGVPEFRGRPSQTALARQFVPGTPLLRGSAVDDEFFPLLLRLLERIHERGIAYVDLEKAENILQGDDGRPHLIDFQIAFYVPVRLGGHALAVRWIRECLQRADRYHVLKHFRRSRPDQLGEDGLADSRRKPLPVRLGNRLIAPWKRLRRAVLRRGKEK